MGARSHRRGGAAAFVLLAVAGLCSAACDNPGDLDDADRTDPCTATGPLPALSGTWFVAGQGKREQCTEEKYSTSFDLETPAGLAIVATPLAVSAPVDGGNGAPAALTEATLALAEPSSVISVDGRARGICVRFTTTENTPAGKLVFSFELKVTQPGVLKGKVTGTGPEGCVASGSATVTIR